MYMSDPRNDYGVGDEIEYIDTLHAPEMTKRGVITQVIDHRPEQTLYIVAENGVPVGDISRLSMIAYGDIMTLIKKGIKKSGGRRKSRKSRKVRRTRRSKKSRRSRY
jgi:hypothetical protein